MIAIVSTVDMVKILMKHPRMKDAVNAQQVQQPMAVPGTHDTLIEQLARHTFTSINAVNNNVNAVNTNVGALTTNVDVLASNVRIRFSEQDTTNAEQYRTNAELSARIDVIETKHAAGKRKERKVTCTRISHPSMNWKPYLTYRNGTWGYKRVKGKNLTNVTPTYIEKQGFNTSIDAHTAMQKAYANYEASLVEKIAEEHTDVAPTLSGSSHVDDVSV